MCRYAARPVDGIVYQNIIILLAICSFELNFLQFDKLKMVKNSSVVVALKKKLYMYRSPWAPKS